MADGQSTLDDMIARLRRLGGDDVGERVAKGAVAGVDEAVKATARAGTSPMGSAWKAKKDGGRPLAHAADHISTAARGPIVVVTLTGPDVFHHKGLGGKPRRQVIPDAATVPPSVWKAVHASATREFLALMGGGR
jgi:hypothetical protein